MSPRWLTMLAWVSIAAALLTTGAIAFDVLVRHRRQRMRVMEIVWPVTALYFGPFALPAYRRWGLPNSTANRDSASDSEYGKPFWATVAVGVGHCGAGCTLGDIFGGWLVLLLGLQIAGLAVFAEYPVDFALAFTLGIAFQYFAIAPMRGLGPRKGLPAALKADAASLTAFEIGMFGWMAVVQLVLFAPTHLSADHPTYWLMMQIGMVLGFVTAFPVNWWLIRRGIKEPM